MAQPAGTPLDSRSQAAYQEYATAKAAGTLKGKGLVVKGQYLEFRKLDRLERWGKTIGIGNASERALAKFGVNQPESCKEFVQKMRDSDEKLLFVFKAVNTQDVNGLEVKQAQRQNKITRALGELISKMILQNGKLNEDDFETLHRWYPTPEELKTAFTTFRNPAISVQYLGDTIFGDSQNNDFLTQICSNAKPNLVKAVLGSLDSKKLVEKLDNRESPLDLALTRKSEEILSFIIDKLPLSERQSLFNVTDAKGKSIIDNADRSIKPNLEAARNKAIRDALNLFVKSQKLKVDPELVRALAGRSADAVRRAMTKPKVLEQAHALFSKAVECKEWDLLLNFLQLEPTGILPKETNLRMLFDGISQNESTPVKKKLLGALLIIAEIDNNKEAIQEIAKLPLFSEVLSQRDFLVLQNVCKLEKRDILRIFLQSPSFPPDLLVAPDLSGVVRQSLYEKSDPEIATLIASKVCEGESGDKRGAKCLHYACAQGNLVLVQALAKKLSLEALNSIDIATGKTALDKMNENLKIRESVKRQIRRVIKAHSTQLRINFP